MVWDFLSAGKTVLPVQSDNAFFPTPSAFNLCFFLHFVILLLLHNQLVNLFAAQMLNSRLPKKPTETIPAKTAKTSQIPST